MEAGSKNRTDRISLAPKKVPEEITEADYRNFMRVVSVELSDEQRRRILNPPEVHPRQEAVLAVHWHPEYIPMDLIAQRLETVFPNKKTELIIPTQHNVLMTYGDYAGVEVDCLSTGFNQKVQLLLHFEKERVENADVLKAMLDHTFKYRSSQLFEFINAIIKPNEDWLERAAEQTGANEALIGFVQIYVKKVHDLLDQNMDRVPAEMIKNKLLRNFFDTLRPEYGDALIDRAQTLLTAVKKIVKENFSLGYFYRTSEVIEEARAHGAGVVIPHPEQFWPVLLAEYDVDGYEVWNPQSRKYTEFLISVLNRNNRRRDGSDRELLVFMGDDTHMAEKLRDPAEQSKEKAGREVGVQPAWDDLSIRKGLILANMSRRKVIEEYKSRLAS
jgi:hypothetical protein